ncbi:hypothetical protein N9917_01665 [Deltaproteobacteria bacterium]|nr:hypothetical protein [Deltaproteobacteria bacterium]
MVVDLRVLSEVDGLEVGLSEPFSTKSMTCVSSKRVAGLDSDGRSKDDEREVFLSMMRAYLQGRMPGLS